MLWKIAKLAIAKVLLLSALVLKQHSFRGFRLALSSEQYFKFREAMPFGDAVGDCW